MAQPQTQLQPAQMIEVLQSHPSFSRYRFLVLPEWDDPRFAGPVCTMLGLPDPCPSSCPSFSSGIVSVSDKGYRLLRCGRGLLGFLIPAGEKTSGGVCIVGTGVRDRSVEVAGTDADGRRLRCFPALPLEEVEQAAEKVVELLPFLQGMNPYHQVLEDVCSRLGSIREVLHDMDRARSAADALSLFCEAAGVLFQVPRIAVALPSPEGGRMTVAAGWNLPEGTPLCCGLTLDQLEEERKKHVVLGAEEAAAIFPEIECRSVLCLALPGEGCSRGLVFFFDAAVAGRDLLLLDILGERLSTSLCLVAERAARSREAQTSSRLLEMVTDLARTDRSEHLYPKILQMAAELTGATCGSVMLLAEGGEELLIRHALGMAGSLARSMKIRVGSGIAGKVASGGKPILVNDIEKDDRFSTTNRPRFRTKSFVSVPLAMGESVVGVVNLSDKRDGGIFTADDLSLLSSFLEHAVVALQRAETVERAQRMEQLSVTDPLTGLYNRRFLEKRLEEEISRSGRQKQPVTVMIIDVDDFKAYNDRCGHLAGDDALKRIAAILRQSARQMDVVTRYGGEEFCIVLPGTAKRESIFIAERVRHGIESEAFPQEDALPLGRLTVSIGIASFPEDARAPAPLIGAADIALYRTKAQGKNHIVFFEEAMKQAENNALRARGSAGTAAPDSSCYGGNNAP